MSKIILSARNEKSKHGYPVQLTMRVGNSRLRFNTGIFLHNRANIINNHIVNEEYGAIYNTRLSGIISRIELFLLDNPSISQLKEFVSNLILDRHNREYKLLEVFDEFVASTKQNRSTLSIYGQTRSKIMTYDKNAVMDNIDTKWLSGIERMMVRQGMKINSIAINMRNIRAVFNYAIDEEYTRNYPFRKFKIKQEQTAKRSLGKDILIRIRDCKYTGFMAEYRDMFMLMFYLIGINAADLFSLSHSALKDGRIIYHRKKTGKLYSVRVEPEAMVIIERYKGCRYLLCPLDRYSDYRDYLHHMNDGLKNLGRKFKDGVGWSGKAIYPTLTSYYARHSWATIAFEIGVPKDIISLALGHSFGVAVTDTYIEYSTKQVDDANRRVLDCLKVKG